jgi:integrase
MEGKLTSYVSRHSWATIAKEKGIPISLISLGLGHESEKTTMIYLDACSYSNLHEANKKIINYTKKVS